MPLRHMRAKVPANNLLSMKATGQPSNDSIS
jgi:hypothetical protein